MENKNFTEILDQIKEISKKLNDPSTSIEDSIDLFKNGTAIIKEAKQHLETIEGEVNKVLENNQVEDFK
ncbi:exodeoxyribonuclease VII small subunit [Spiroplasma culicicola]|uniref:Exodeoxyribonuclease VII small subunit n=1 Tax=Spiroplasma culicicola AES-1 TaxID=1276246 RepID=W6AGU2_9MOLU|nr:exodeoxyribonuclease VII small subunit [Spiroplasma culicicola]AHI52909.1 hypothetical protein SCULI_v1c05680 [Spiroplasma culicicola AES-1]